MVLNEQILASFDPKSFKSIEPFSWINPQGLIKDEYFDELRNNLPDMSLFSETAANDDYRTQNRLEYMYKPGDKIPDIWQQLIDELNSPMYQDFVKKMFGKNKVNLRYQWHLCKKGFHHLPHLDSVRKIGSHIFYLNTESDWDESWGGQTVFLLVPEGKKPFWHANPDVSYFDGEFQSEIFGNRSLFWKNSKVSWHYVKEIKCPDDKIRKIFTVIIEEDPKDLRMRLRHFVQKKVVPRIRKIPELVAGR